MRVALQWKVLAGYLLVAGVGLGVGGWLALQRLEAKDIAELQSGLMAQTRLVADIFRVPLAATSSDRQETIDSVADRLGETIHARITVIRSDGTVLGDSYESGEGLDRMDNHLTRPEVVQALSTGIGVSVRESQTVGLRMLNVAVPVYSPDHRVLGLVRLSLPLTEIEAQHRTLRNLLAAALGIAFVLSLILSYVVARNITRPLAAMVTAAGRMARGEFHSRIRPESHDEVSELAQVLNTMAASVEEKIRALHEDRAKMAATLTAMQEGVMVLERDGTVELINPAMARMLGRDEAEVLRLPYLEVTRQPALNRFITEVLARGEIGETEIILGTGPQRTYQVRASTMPGGNQKSTGLVLVFHDITELRRLEQVRKDFLANVSHELRTPLTAIKGYVEALRDDPKVELDQRNRFLEIVDSHTDRLNLIITDLLLLSKIESGQIPLKQEPIDIAGVIDRTVRLLTPLITRKQHKILVPLHTNLPPVLGDEERLGQIFSNLLDNAIKYTPEHGTITITAGLQDGMVAVAVEDTGIGIPPQDLPRIFERFYRVDKARSRELGGTGLGLAIVKHLVEAHGGTVWAESAGKGSRFTVRLRIAGN
jgi:two-component system, OmpR family, phosphate regulon sensor histidine kinase PhoR